MWEASQIYPNSWPGRADQSLSAASHDRSARTAISGRPNIENPETSTVRAIGVVEGLRLVAVRNRKSATARTRTTG